MNQRTGEDWDLGVNLELPDAGREPPGWFSDVEEIAVFLRLLSDESGRDFVIGIADAKTGISPAESSGGCSWRNG